MLIEKLIEKLNNSCWKHFFFCFTTHLLARLGSLCYYRSYHPIDRSALSNRMGLWTIRMTVFLIAVASLMVFLSDVTLVYAQLHSQLCPMVQQYVRFWMRIKQQCSFNIFIWLVLEFKKFFKIIFWVIFFIVTFFHKIYVFVYLTGKSQEKKIFLLLQWSFPSVFCVFSLV